MSPLVNISNTIEKKCNNHNCFCGVKFNSERINQIISYYINLDVKHRQNFIALNVKRESGFILWSINSVKVCIKYFMNAFKIKNTETVYKIIDKKTRNYK